MHPRLSNQNGLFMVEAQPTVHPCVGEDTEAACILQCKLYSNVNYCHGYILVLHCTDPNDIAAYHGLYF